MLTPLQAQPLFRVHVRWSAAVLPKIWFFNQIVALVKEIIIQVGTSVFLECVFVLRMVVFEHASNWRFVGAAI